MKPLTPAGDPSLLLKDLYRRVILTRETAVTLLQDNNNLLDTQQEADPCHQCGTVMQEKQKHDRDEQFRPVFTYLYLPLLSLKEVSNSMFS